MKLYACKFFIGEFERNIARFNLVCDVEDADSQVWFRNLSHRSGWRLLKGVKPDMDFKLSLEWDDLSVEFPRDRITKLANDVFWQVYPNVVNLKWVKDEWENGNVFSDSEDLGSCVALSVKDGRTRKLIELRMLA